MVYLRTKPSLSSDGWAAFSINLQSLSAASLPVWSVGDSWVYSECGGWDHQSIAQDRLFLLPWELGDRERAGVEHAIGSEGNSPVKVDPMAARKGDLVLYSGDLFPTEARKLPSCPRSDSVNRKGKPTHPSAPLVDAVRFYEALVASLRRVEVPPHLDESIYERAYSDPGEGDLTIWWPEDHTSFGTEQRVRVHQARSPSLRWGRRQSAKKTFSRKRVRSQAWRSSHMADSEWTIKPLQELFNFLYSGFQSCGIQSSSRGPFDEAIDAAEVDSLFYVDSAAYVYEILLGEHLLARARLRDNLINLRWKDLWENDGRLGNFVEPSSTDVLKNNPQLARAEADRARLQWELEEERRKMLYFCGFGDDDDPLPEGGAVSDGFTALDFAIVEFTPRP
ncbi:hypothetical protein NE237_016134 [Protea cynaroides]|uniref:Uncharacterized protein n=1 Tax=Protea cynaroides TaxID=273540 RepID=A0A9Q0QRR2_9MAGN|nr:hypothetical protein NE237_016134 [Protea cynaroides]